MADYYTLLTTGGLAYETACKAAGTPIKLTKMSVGDGNGQVYNPDATATALKREVWRGDINALIQDATNTSWLIAELTIPDDVGGWYVREAGIWTDTGILYAIVKYPESYKPVMATSGSAKEFYLRAIFQTSNASSVTLAIDETVVKATRAWVADYVAAELAKRDAKQSVRVATTATITLSGAQTIDGVAVVAGDRVLVKDQAASAANGIYVAATGAWARAADADISAEVTPGLLVSIEEGVANANTLWQLLTDATIVLGTTPLVFGPFYNNAQINAMLALKANLSSPAFTDKPTAPTAPAGTSTDQLATTSFVQAALAAFGIGVGQAPAVTDLNAVTLNSVVRYLATASNVPVAANGVCLNINFNVGGQLQIASRLSGGLSTASLYWRTCASSVWTAWREVAMLDSPAFIGTPSAPTPATSSNSTQLATTAFVQAAITALVGSAPAALDTLNELATALGNDANFATTMTNALAGKVPLAGGQMTGPLRAKVGAATANNANAAGFVFDIDTGLFSPSDGVIQVAADGTVLLQGASGSALQVSRAIRVPKGAPQSVDQSYQTGYTFADDGDTGMFAEGGSSANAGSDLVFRLDGTEGGRIKAVMKSSGANGWARLMNGQILQWAEFTVSNTAGQVLNWQVTLPTTFPNKCLQKWATLGSGCTATKALLTVEGQTNNSLLGYLYSEEAVSRVIRVWAIGE